MPPQRGARAMAERLSKRRFRLKRWPTPDWEEAHVGYRFIKTTFQLPVTWASRLHVQGREHVPSEGGVLLAVNHFSWADPVLVGAAIERPAHYLAKEAVFRNPLAAQFFYAMGQIKVNRDVGGNEDAVATAVDWIGRGRVIGVFPEGTRSRPGQVRRGRTGVARISALAGVPVIPVAVDSQAFWPRGRALPKLGEKVYLKIGAPMDLGLKPEDAQNRQKMRDVTDDVMQRIRSLLADAVAAKEAGESWG